MSIGVKLGVEGEKQFKAALSDANAQMRLLASEMLVVTSRFDAGDKSTEALTARGEALAKSIEGQKQKIDILTSGLNNASESFGENDRRTVLWQTNLNKAQAELNKMERELQGAADGASELGDKVKDSGESAEKSGGKFEKLGGVLKGVGATMGAVAVAAGAAAIKLGKEVVQQFGELEQNLGGAEAVFGEHADRMKQIGEDAYKNMGTSQSQYLATANKMGALFQGSGLDVERSAELTEKAMQRAVDMASVMGIDVQMALDSVAGAAKGNFTMMDNLGVAMNATTIQAYALAKGLVATGGGAGEAEVDTKKLADAQDKVALAIIGVESAEEKHRAAIEKYGEESTQAVQAALNLEKAQIAFAAANRKVEEAMAPASEAVGNWWANASQAEKAEVAMQMFFENTEQYAGNFAKESTQTVTGALGLMTAATSSFIAGLGNADADMVNLTQNMVDAFGSVIDNIVPVLENIVTALPAAVGALLPAIAELLPILLETATSLFSQVLGAILELLPELIPAAVSALLTIAEALIENLPLIIDGAIQIIMALVNGLTDAIPRLIPAIMTAIMTIFRGFIDNIPTIVKAGIALLLALVDGLLAALPELIAALPEIIHTIYDNVYGAIPGMIQAAISLFLSIVEAFPTIIAGLVEAIPLIIEGIIDALLTNIPLIVGAGVQLLVALVQNVPGIVFEVVKAVPKIIVGIVEAIVKSVPKLAEAGLELIQGLWQGIKDAGAWLWDKISGFFDGIVEKIKDFFGIASPSKLFKDEIGKNLAEGVGEGFADEMKGVTKKMQKAIPTNFDTDVSVAAKVYGSQGGAGGTKEFNVVIPLNIDGQRITQVVSRVQYDLTNNRARVLGVTV